MWADTITYSGWLVSVGSLAYAIYQGQNVKSLERRNHEQLELFIEDTNYISFEHELIDVIFDKTNDKTLNRFLISSHQRGCDLYRNIVSYYISSRKSFIYEELGKICSTPLITHRWQEDFWRGRIALLEGNKGITVPTDRFVKESKKPRTEFYKAQSD